jgi:hypothetical protein
MPTQMHGHCRVYLGLPPPPPTVLGLMYALGRPRPTLPRGLGLGLGAYPHPDFAVENATNTFIFIKRKSCVKVSSAMKRYNLARTDARTNNLK